MVRLGLRQPSFGDERLKRARGLEDGRRAGGIIVGPEHRVALEDVRRDDDFLGLGVRAGDRGDDVLELGLFRLRFDDGVDRDLFATLQAIAEEDAFARRHHEGELGLGAADVEPAPGDEQGVEERPRRGKGNDPGRPHLEAADIVDLAGGARRDQDLVLDIEPLEVLRLAFLDPDELGGDVGRGAAGGQHGGQVGVGGDLLPSRLDLPQLALDPVPGLAAREAQDGRFGQSGFLEAVEDVLGLGERSGVFRGLAVAREAAHGHDMVHGRFARGLADDLVHQRLGQEGPLQPRRHLRGGREADEEEGQGQEAEFFPGHFDSPFSIPHQWSRRTRSARGRRFLDAAESAA